MSAGLRTGRLLLVKIPEFVFGPADGDKPFFGKIGEYLLLDCRVVQCGVGGFSVGKNEGHIQNGRLGHEILKYGRGDGGNLQGAALDLLRHGAFPAQLAHGKGGNVDSAVCFLFNIGRECIHALALSVKGGGPRDRILFWPRGAATATVENPAIKASKPNSTRTRNPIFIILPP